jgi:hypothetical protein
MRDDQIAQLKAALRPFGEEAIQPGDVKLLQLIKRAINEAGIIRPGAIPILPPNAHGTINDESIAVAITGYSGITNLEEMLIHILAGLAAPPLAVQEADGTPSGTVSTIILPNGSLAVDDDSDTATVTFASSLGDVVGPSSSVDSEVALFDGVTGKLLKRATGTGVVKVASGVFAATATINDLAAQSADYSANSHKITNVTDPASAQDAATKGYVDAVATGLDVKASVRVATAAALAANTRTGNVLTASANGALASIDGVSLSVADRLLVKDEATGANNGLYVVTSLGSGGTPWVLTRSTDADASAEVTSGLFTFATEGTANGDKGWVLTTNDPITLNTTALVFSQFSTITSYDLAIDIHAATSKATPVDADELALADSAASFGLKKLTWANLKATAKTYFDTLYAATSSVPAMTSGIDLAKWVTANYYARIDMVGALDLSTTGNALTADTMQAGLFPVVADSLGNLPTFDQVAINVTNLIALSTIRLGVYAMGTDGKPGALIADWGTVSSASTGDKTLSISWAPSAGQYYLVMVSTHGPSALRQATGRHAPIGHTTIGTFSQATDYTRNVAGSSAALPNPFGTPVAVTNHRPIWLRVA